MKRVLGLLAALGAGTALVLTWPSSSNSRSALEPDPSSVLPVQERPSNEQPDPRLARENAAAPREPREPVRDGTGAGSPRTSAAEVSGPVQPVGTGRVEIRGRVTVHNAGDWNPRAGSTADRDLGSLVLSLHDSSGYRQVRKTITDRQFRFTCEETARLQIHQIMLGGEHVIVEPEFTSTFSASRFPSEILGRVPAVTTVRVFDKGSGQELSEIHVSRERDPRETSLLSFPQSENLTVLAESQATPFRLPGPVLSTSRDRPTQMSPSAVYWIGAPKHALKRLVVEYETGGERRVYLERGASLRVEIGGDRSALSASDRTVLRIRTPGHRSISKALWHAELDASTPSVETPVLPVGTWRLSIERGPETGPEILTEETVKVLFSDEGRVVRLDIPDLRSKPGEASLEGEIVLHGGFDPMFLTVRAEAIEVDGVDAGDTHARFTCHAAAGQPMPYHFSLPQGRWRVHLEPLGLSSEVELYASGLRGVDFIPPAPARVEVQVRSKSSGETLFPGQLRWRSGSGSGVDTIVRAREDEPGLYEFQTLPGELEIRCSLRGYRYLARRVEVQAGSNAFTMELDRDCSVRIQFLDGETRVPWQRRHLASVQPLDGSGKLFGASGGSVLFTEEGEYELRFHNLDGFRDPEPVRIRVDCLEPEKLEIQLDRQY